MNEIGGPRVPSRSVWYAIIYDRQGNKRDYLDGFDTLEQAQIWLLRNLAPGERGEAGPGHTLRATGEALYYAEGHRLLTLRDEASAVRAA